MSRLWWSGCCRLCQCRCSDKDLCDDCERELCGAPQRCSVCGLAVHTPNHCPDCARYQFSFDRAVVGFCYEGLGRQLIHQYKFERRRGVGRLLSAMVLRSMPLREEQVLPDVIVPVPTHPWHRFVRGFNPPDDLAYDLAASLHLPVCHPFQAHFQRRRQSQRTRTDRFHQVASKFSIARGLEGTHTHIALVDDVMTTGATLSALSALLRRQGVEQVSCWVVARTPHSGNVEQT